MKKLSKLFIVAALIFFGGVASAETTSLSLGENNGGDYLSFSADFSGYGSFCKELGNCTNAGEIDHPVVSHNWQYPGDLNYFGFYLSSGETYFYFTLGTGACTSGNIDDCTAVQKYKVYVEECSVGNPIVYDPDHICPAGGFALTHFEIYGETEPAGGFTIATPDDPQAGLSAAAASSLGNLWAVLLIALSIPFSFYIIDQIIGMFPRLKEKNLWKEKK